jgi:hypothetical protein
MASSSASNVLKETAAARARNGSSSATGGRSSDGDIHEYLTECKRIMFTKATVSSTTTTATPTPTAAATTAPVVMCPTHHVPLGDTALQTTHKVSE